MLRLDFGAVCLACFLIPFSPLLEITVPFILYGKALLFPLEALRKARNFQQNTNMFATTAIY